MLGLLKFWREAIIALLLIAVAGQQMRVDNEKSAHATTRAGNAKVLRDLADKTLAAYKARVAEDEARKEAAAALDAKHTKELTDALSENTRLADAVRTGQRRLRLNATYTPSAGTGVPPAASAASVADAEGPRLTAAAERNYFDLRAGIATAQQQIAGLQDYVRDVCLK